MLSQVTAKNVGDVFETQCINCNCHFPVHIILHGLRKKMLFHEPCTLLSSLPYQYIEKYLVGMTADSVTLCGKQTLVEFTVCSIGYFDVAGEAAVEGSACTRAHLSADHSRHRQRIQPAIRAVK